MPPRIAVLAIHYFPYRPLYMPNLHTNITGFTEGEIDYEIVILESIPYLRIEYRFIDGNYIRRTYVYVLDLFNRDHIYYTEAREDYSEQYNLLDTDYISNSSLSSSVLSDPSDHWSDNSGLDEDREDMTVWSFAD